MKDAFASIRQEKKEDIAEYLIRFIDAENTCASHGYPVEPEEDRAVHFTLGLNNSFDSMLAKLREDEALGHNGYKDTLADAYESAEKWLAARQKRGPSNTPSSQVFVISDTPSSISSNSEQVFAVTPSKKRTTPQSSGLDKKQRHSTSTGVRLPDDVWQAIPRSDQLAILAGRRTASTSPSPSHKTSPSPSRTGTKEWASMSSAEKKLNAICGICRAKGHYASGCPKTERTPASAHFTDAYEESEEDEVLHLDISSLQLDDSRKHIATTGYIDSCASTNIVATAQLLTNIRKRARKMIIHGVNGSGKPLIVTQEGDLGVFGAVPFHPEARVNILSQPTVVDAGFDVTYNSSKCGIDPDTYFVQTPDSTRKFAFRRTKGETTFYACDFRLFSDPSACQDDNPTGATLVGNADPAYIAATIAENMKSFTKVEVAKAKEARNLIAKLGCCVKKTIETLPNIANCTVTKQDILNADTIFGPLISHLKGKTRKIKNAVVPDPMPRRESLPAQQLFLDLMFIKQEPFLIGISIPLELKISEHLKRFSSTEGPRAAASVRVAIDHTTSTLSSQGFTVTNMYCDGEGALHKLRSEINGNGMVLETSPPDNHDSHVESQIGVIKQRVRCIENSLPYVMCRSLLIAAVIYCVSRMNFVSTRNSTDNISPFTKFYNETLDLKKHFSIGFGAYCQVTNPEGDNTMKERSQGAIMCMPGANSYGGSEVFLLTANKIVLRRTIRELPTPDNVIQHLTGKAEREGFSRGSHDPSIGPDESDDRETDDDDTPQSNLRLADATTPTAAGMELLIRGVPENPPQVYWHAPTTPNAPAQSSLPLLS